MNLITRAWARLRQLYMERVVWNDFFHPIERRRVSRWIETHDTIFHFLADDFNKAGAQLSGVAPCEMTAIAGQLAEDLMQELEDRKLV